MAEANILFEEDDDVAGYFGVKVSQDEDNDTITLSQHGLANRIVEALHLENFPSADISADGFLPLLKVVNKEPLLVFPHPD